MLGEVLGEVTTRTGYNHIIEIFQARFEALRAAGNGMVGKLTIDHFKRWGPVTLACQLGVLGVKLVAVVDPVAFAQIKDRA